MKLISMIDFVLEDNGIHQIVAYANFLKQPLALWMFVPCDEDGIPYKYNDNTGNNAYDREYTEAKERCLFEGFKYDGYKYVEYSNICLRIERLNNKTIENLVKYNLELTASAQKQMKL